ncbi:hypothetical protein NDU88_001902 [Pleurodeles waltl]|uniref:Uncharacterized protein n=1 Tax=Pleurodeles waltl TaxID=8319 RepID=A0AAV7U7Q4_PLEWA|nr:hypothetical protein NDU88_001902 [Pleurodeles waltl]
MPPYLTIARSMPQLFLRGRGVGLQRQNRLRALSEARDPQPAAVRRTPNKSDLFHGLLARRIHSEWRIPRVLPQSLVEAFGVCYPTAGFCGSRWRHTVELLQWLVDAVGLDWPLCTMRLCCGSTESDLFHGLLARRIHSEWRIPRVLPQSPVEALGVARCTAYLSHGRSLFANGFEALRRNPHSYGHFCREPSASCARSHTPPFLTAAPAVNFFVVGASEALQGRFHPKPP